MYKKKYKIYNNKIILKNGSTFYLNSIKIKKIKFLIFYKIKNS